MIVIARVRIERRLAGILLLLATLFQHLVNLGPVVILLQRRGNRFQLQLTLRIHEVLLLEETFHETFRGPVVRGKIAIAQLGQRFSPNACLGHTLQRENAYHLLLAQGECL